MSQPYPDNPFGAAQPPGYPPPGQQPQSPPVPQSGVPQIGAPQVAPQSGVPLPAGYWQQQQPTGDQYGNPYNDPYAVTQPGFQQPGYQQPGYQQPGYQAPEYQQPGVQSQGVSFQPGQNIPNMTVAPDPKRNALLAIAGLLVLLLIIGGITIAMLSKGGTKDEPLSQSSSTSASPTSPSPSASSSSYASPKASQSGKFRTPVTLYTKLDFTGLTAYGTPDKYPKETKQVLSPGSDGIQVSVTLGSVDLQIGLGVYADPSTAYNKYDGNHVSDRSKYASNTAAYKELTSPGTSAYVYVDPSKTTGKVTFWLAVYESNMMFLVQMQFPTGTAGGTAADFSTVSAAMIKFATDSLAKISTT